MDEYSVSAQLEKLRAEIAALHAQERVYRQTRHHSYPDKLAHDNRERRLIEIKAELERLQRKTKLTR